MTPTERQPNVPSAPGDTAEITAAFARAVAEACSGEDADHAYWEAVRGLQRSEPAEVFRRLRPLATDANPRLRMLVPDTLRFLGGPTQPLLQQALGVVTEMLAAAQPADVIASIAAAFVDFQHPSALALLRPHLAHPDAGVRQCIVAAFLPVANEALAELIALSSDTDADVRNWATFGLATHFPAWSDDNFVPSPERRDALWARHDDPHEETRLEAMVGLARMRDHRALQLIQRSLETPTELTYDLDAATEMADPRLLPLLLRRREAGDDCKELKAAIAACTPGAR